MIWIRKEEVWERRKEDKFNKDRERGNILINMERKGKEYART